MDSTTDKKSFLLEEPEAGKSCRIRKNHNPWAVLCTLLVFLLAVFGAAFVGGYFLGKDHGKKVSTTNSTQSSYQHRAYSVNYEGDSHIIPAFRGSLPVHEFIQPRSVLIDQQLVTVPGNPLLTPKGTTQIFIYQYKDEVSLIVTATGQNYGERVDDPSLAGEGQYTLTTEGLQGYLVPLADGYHQVYNRVQIPDSLSVNVQWGNVGSHGYIFVLSDPSTLDATIHFSTGPGSQQPLNIRGCNTYDTEIPDIPSPSHPLRITPYKGKISLQNGPDSDSQSETPVPVGSKSSNLKLVQLSSGSRRRRSGSMATRTPPGLGFILYKPNTTEVQHRVDLKHEDRHGGKNGTMCWTVHSFVQRVEASICIFFHEVLYNGLKTEEELQSALVNVHFRNMADIRNDWKHIAFLVHDSDLRGVMDRLRNRNTRGIGSFFHSLGSKIKGVASDVGHGVEKAWNGVKHTVETASHAVADEVEKAYHTVANGAEKLLHEIASKWHCALAETLLKVAECLKSGVECGTDIAGEEETVGLDTVATVWNCASAVKDCAGIFKDCL
jgi:hypothetical protein